MTIYTVYPYVISEANLAELEKAGITHTEEKVKISLNYEDLPTKHSSESDTHRALKKIAYEMLQRLGEPEPKYEYAYYDVYGPSLGIVIECGTTQVDKLLEAFFRWFNLTLKEFWNLDYSDKEGNAELVKFKRQKP